MDLFDKFASLFGYQAGAPIFIHSSFRTSSTWIWSKFRAHPGVLAYYEFFHEDLESISATGIKALRPDHWESGHPGMEPYFKEFIPLLRRKGGIAGFDHSMAFERFFPAGGYNGVLSGAEVSYVERLIARAARLRRKPCLACKRSLGRLRALKQSIGGTHIVLQRSLLAQWRSYREQVFIGNPYFLDTLLRTIALNQQEPFMAFLGDFARALPGGSADIVSSQLGSDDLFSVFVAFHCYLYLLTVDDADLVIRTSGLADVDYRRAVEESLKSSTGLAIDLTDARASAVSPCDLVEDIDRVRRNVEELCDRARRDANKNAAQGDAVRPLLQELYQKS